MTTALENILTPAAEITIGAKTFKMVFDFVAVAEVEEKTGRNLLSQEGWEYLSGRDISLVFWATLQAYHQELTLTAVRRLMNSKNIELVTNKIKEAWTLSKPEVVEADTADKPADPQ